MPEPLRIGVAGLGTVGCGVLALLRDNAALLEQRTGRPIEAVAVSSRDRGKDRGVPLDGLDWRDDARALAAHPDVDVVVELIGGSEGIARALSEAAFANGKHLVTANKALLAHHGAALADAARQADCHLGYEAAVAGGIPIVKALREGLAGNRIGGVYGILNGTCNYIMTAMHESVQSRPGARFRLRAAGGAGARLRGGRSLDRHRRHRRGPQARDPHQRRVRLPGRLRRRARRGHSPRQRARHRLRHRARLPGQAPGNRPRRRGLRSPSGCTPA